jgi:tetratricopeptide (TPR) repeat protein
VGRRGRTVLFVDPGIGTMGCGDATSSMKSVLHKTMASLETALKYNPTSLELQASLAEVYVRLGRFDERTMELCTLVLDKQIDNVLLQQAQAIGMVIDQSRQIEQRLGKGEAPPPGDALHGSLLMLEEFLHQSPECVDAWVAWTRLLILSCQFDRAQIGFEKLRSLDVRGLDELYQHSLRYMSEHAEITAVQARQLADVYEKLGLLGAAARLFEKLYDHENPAAGPTLLSLYLKRYSLNQAAEIPEDVRTRLFVLLLDYADHDTMDQWLRKAMILGWEINSYTNDYARILIEQGDLEEAFVTLQRLALNEDVKVMLNEIAAAFEQRDEVDRAVAVLRYINDNELVAPEQLHARETELVRDAQLSMAELQMKSGRYGEALEKFISALLCSPQIDLNLLMQIDELLEIPGVGDVESLLRLGLFFRQRGDHPKALFYLNLALERSPENRTVLGELEALFREILSRNPDLPQLRLELGRLYLRTQRRDDAVLELALAAAGPNQAQEANRLLATIFVTDHQWNEALDKFRSVVVNENDFEMLWDIHAAFAERNQWREALMAIDLIARVNPRWREAAEKVRFYEERIGKLQPEVVSDPKMRELIGDLAIGRYQYIDKLGSGGMGVVYKVFDIRNRRVAAMKILRDSLAGSSKALDRFFREARIAATLNHRNIVNIFDYNISNVTGQSYIVMEYVDGPSLRELIDRQFQSQLVVSLDYVAEILHYSVQLCDALNASHVKGIVHRDIKPDNIMINTQGEVKITDFGIVHIEEATFTPTGAMLGTPRYMAPEQVTGGRIDGRSDIYSVGILLYEVLVGSPPFLSGDISYQQVHNAPVPPREINPTIPQSCGEIILKCLAKKPEERFQDAMALRHSLAAALDALGGCAKYQNVNVTEYFEPDSPAPDLDPELDHPAAVSVHDLDGELDL